MAQIVKRTTTRGDRFDARVRVAGRVVTKTFRRRRDAEDWAKLLEADRGLGVAVDPAAGQIKQADYAAAVTKALREAGLRAVSDLSNNKITYKIREHSLQKLPYQVVVGDKEMEAGLVAVRARGNQDLGQLELAAFIARVQDEIRARS